MNEIIRDLKGVEGREEVTLAAVAPICDIVFTPDGRAAICATNKPGAVGDIVPVCTDAIVSLDSASATTFTVGAAVGWNSTTKLAVAGATAGSRAVGFAYRAKTSGQLNVLVRLNGPAPQVQS
jgi:predicted RecA/RadA family phage recombinase